MSDYKFYKNIQILAMNSVEGEDPDYFLSRIYRWYSRNFNTPLHEVYDLPKEFVLRHYFEEKFSEMYNAPDEESFQKYKDHRALLLMTDKELIEHYKAKEETEKEDETWEKELLEKMGQEASSDAPQQSMVNQSDIDSIMQELDIPEKFSMGGEDDDPFGQ